jgi:hypothetical protein
MFRNELLSMFKSKLFSCGVELDPKLGAALVPVDLI